MTLRPENLTAELFQCNEIQAHHLRVVRTSIIAEEDESKMSGLTIGWALSFLLHNWARAVSQNGVVYLQGLDIIQVLTNE